MLNLACFSVHYAGTISKVYYFFFFFLVFQSKILHYMRQMAVITPYAQFLFKFLSETPEYSLSCQPILICPSLHDYLTNQVMIFFVHFSKNVTVRFARRTDIMPPIPVETKYHPSAVDLLLIKRLIAETSKQYLLQFLQHEFVNVGKAYAERLIGKT